jgi:hypothetical protein
MSQALTHESATFLSAPGTMLRAITPADGVALPLGVCKALIVGGAGNLSVVAEDDVAAVTIPVQAGQVVPVRIKFVQAATSATGIVAIY